MKAADRQMDRCWPAPNNDPYRTAIELEELAEIYCPAATPEVLAARTCRRGGCRRAHTCGRPRTCAEPSMMEHRNLMQIEAEIRLESKSRGTKSEEPRDKVSASDIRY
jgi:hypothetical protein